MKHKYRIIAVTVAALGMSAVAYARPLAPELGGLIVEHPLIKAARKQIEASDYGRDAANAGYFPKVNVYGDTGSERIDTQGYIPINNNINASNSRANTQSSDLNRTKISLSIEQNLFAGGRTAAQTGIAEIDFALQENGFRSTMQGTLLEGIVSYLQVARYQILIAIAKRNEATTQRQLNLEDERVQRGGGIAVDVLQSKARLQLSKERRVLSEQGLRDAIATYRQVFGHEPDLGRIEDVDILAMRMPASLEAAREMAYQQNPTLTEARLFSQKTAKQISVESAGFYPSIDLVGTTSQDKNTNQLAQRQETSLLVKMNWNVFNGLETRARSKGAGSQHEAAIEREASVLRKTEESVSIAWNQLINGRERESLLENAANISFEVMRNRQRLRDAGKETAINVLDSEVEYYGVLASKINATYDTRIGSYRLLSATGNLLPATLGIDSGKFAVPTAPLIIKLEDPDVAAASLAVRAPKVVVVPPAVAPPAVPAVPAVRGGAVILSVPSVTADPAIRVKTALERWAKFWSERDASGYLATYASDFKPKGLSRERWEEQRKERLAQAVWIKLEISDVKTKTLSDGSIQVTFTQSYSSSHFSETTSKALVFTIEDGFLKIIAED